MALPMAASSTAIRDASSHRESPLLYLPAELRNNIYDSVLGGSIYAVKGSRIFRYAEDPRHDPYLSDLALLCVCRQVHQGTRLFPFNTNTFYFPRLKYLDTSQLRVQPFQVREIRCIRVTCDFAGYNTEDMPLKTLIGRHRFSDMLLGVRHIYFSIPSSPWYNVYRVYTSHAELFDGARLWNFSRVKAWMLEGREREIQIQRSRIDGVNGEEEFKDE